VGVCPKKSMRVKPQIPNGEKEKGGLTCKPHLKKRHGPREKDRRKKKTTGAVCHGVEPRSQGLADLWVPEVRRTRGVKAGAEAAGKKKSGPQIGKKTSGGERLKGITAQPT